MLANCLAVEDEEAVQAELAQLQREAVSEYQSLSPFTHHYFHRWAKQSQRDLSSYPLYLVRGLSHDKQ